MNCRVIMSRDELLAARRQGRTLKEISLETGVGYDTVKDCARGRQRALYRAVDDAAILADLDAGLSIAQVGRLHGVSHRQVSAVAAAARLEGSATLRLARLIGRLLTALDSAADSGDIHPDVARAERDLLGAYVRRVGS